MSSLEHDILIMQQEVENVAERIRVQFPALTCLSLMKHVGTHDHWSVFIHFENGCTSMDMAEFKEWASKRALLYRQFTPVTIKREE